LQDFETVFPLQFAGSTMPVLSMTDNDTLPANVLRAALRGEVQQGLETTFVRPNGQTFQLLMSLGPLLNARGDIAGGIIALTAVIPAHSLASSSFDVNGTLGEQFDFPWWS
jgi:hypothetical protein